jgi:hypothetical protein
MRKTGLFILFLLLLIIPSAHTFRRMDYREGMLKNVCKELKGDVLLYFVFIDNKETSPWTEFDIQSTIDSISLAAKWLQQQATARNIQLKIRTDYYIGNDFATIPKNLSHGTIQKTITDMGLSDGLEDINLWSDGIAKKAGMSYTPPAKDGIPDVKNPRNKERLIAYLRDSYGVESVALILLLNNYFRTDISIPVNTYETRDVEFAVVSYKYPSEIAHNFLHLFGAADLYETPFRRNEKKISQALQEFPRDIMTDPYGRDLRTLEIGPFTRYLIGWDKDLSPKFQPLLTDKPISYKLP